MNCDLAFELMTDAEGCQSTALARHFDHCPRCRHMQETLAPALDLLGPNSLGRSESDLSFPIDEMTSASLRSGQPFVTIEAVRIAQQIATELTMQTGTPRDRLRRGAGKILGYAAVFAAGLLLATLLFERRAPTASPGDECQRGGASREGWERTTGEIRALALSCVACHDGPQNRVENRSTSLEQQRFSPWNWLAPALADRGLLAELNRDPETAPVIAVLMSVNPTPFYKA